MSCRVLSNLEAVSHVQTIFELVTKVEFYIHLVALPLTSGYSYSGLGITEYTEFQFRKKRQFWKRNTHGGGDLRTTMSAHARAAASDFPPKISQKNAYSVYSE